MTSRARLAAFCAVILMTRPAFGEESAASTLSTMVAGLQHLQDRMATGDPAALKAHAAALRSIGAAIDASTGQSWGSESERAAAAIYLLSGGAPAYITRTLQSDPRAGGRVDLLDAAAAFVSSRRGEARKLLGQFDARKADPRLAGQLAYTQAELAVGDSQEKALSSLDLARLLAPGGLTEEAALRRELDILSRSADSEKFVSLARQYARRFSRSAYFDGFRKILAIGVERMSLSDDFSELEKYKSLFAELPAADKRQALLIAARAAVLNGHPSAANYFSHEALKDAALEAREQARARFYQAAARLMLDSDPGAVEDLLRFPVAGLEQRDLNLLAAVRRVASALNSNAPLVANARKETIEAGADDPGKRAIVAAEAAIMRADALRSEDEAQIP